MKTTVFVYKGYVGILSSFDAEGLLNQPKDAGQLGFVVDAASVRFSPEAVEELRKVRKSHDAIGDVDVFRADDGMVVFSWLGGPKKIFRSGDVEGSRTYDPALLTPDPTVEIPEDFKTYVDSL